MLGHDQVLIHDGQVVDIWNAKVFRVLFEPAASRQLQQCLGHVASRAAVDIDAVVEALQHALAPFLWQDQVTFLFLQPEGFVDLCLDQREQRLLAHCLALLRSHL